MSTADGTRYRGLLWFCLALTLQLVIVGGVGIARFSSLHNGRSAYLQIEPVDPRDPFRGDYLTFTYDASTFPMNLLAVDETAAAAGTSSPEPPTITVHRGQVVFVPLVREGRYWVPTKGVSPQRVPEDYYGSDTIVARATVQSVGSEIRVTYGAEQLFLPEGKGQTLPMHADAVARVTVGTNGVMTVRAVMVNGRRWP